MTKKPGGGKPEAPGDGDRRAHVVSNTHWDREWRFGLQESRFMLGRLMRQALEVLERDPAYRALLFDGQTAAIEDYLAIRPEDGPRVRKLVEAGRLHIGPWYTLPDQLPVDGECLVRNLAWGLRLADSYGGGMRVGYTIFSFGQVSQLPQVYAGFGIDTILFAKKVSHARAPESEFTWRSPDGTEALASRFGDLGRANFHMKAHLPVLFGMDYLGPAWTYDWRRQEFPFHVADGKGVERDYRVLAPLLRIHEEKLEKALAETLETTRDTLLKDDRLFMDGSDYTFVHPLTPELVRALDACQGAVRLIHSSLPEYAAVMREKLTGKNLRVVEGEMRDGPPHEAQVNVLSSCIPVKQHNRRAEHDLLRGAEPLWACAWMLGEEYPAVFLREAWKGLLLSHPHDSINGCVYAKSARDIHSRLEQVEEMAEVLSEDAMARVLTHLDRGRLAGEGVYLAVFNTLPYERSAVVTASVDLPPAWLAADIRIEDPAGEPVEFQVCSRRTMAVAMQRDHGRPLPMEVDRWTVRMEAGRLPATGYRVYRVTAAERRMPKQVFWMPMKAGGPGFFTGLAAMENEHVRVTAGGDGTFELTSKVTGQSYPGLHAFRDDGDVGDFWVMKFPDGNRTVTSRGARAEVSRVEDGPLAAALRISLALAVPARADHERSARSSETVPLRISSELRLGRGSRALEVTTTVENPARDHRLQVLFPTGIACDSAHACGQFDVLSRPVGARDENGLVQPELAGKPQLHFVDLSDGTNGLAVLNVGLPEFEVSEDASRTVALTLLRCVRSLICTEFRVGNERAEDGHSQCLGTHEFRYALYPHRGGWDEGAVWQEAEMLAVAPRAVEFGTGPGEGTLAPEQGFLSVSPGVRVSGVTRSEDGSALLVRLFNPAAAARQATVTVLGAVTSAAAVDFREEEQQALPVGDRGVAVEVPAKKIVTVKLVMR